jgi:hypothetical protein
MRIRDKRNIERAFISAAKSYDKMSDGRPRPFAAPTASTPSSSVLEDVAEVSRHEKEPRQLTLLEQ